MPLELIITQPGTVAYREYSIQDVGPHEVRIRVEHGSIKHGTELTRFLGKGPYATSAWSQGEKIFTPRTHKEYLDWAFPVGVGNTVIGHVIEVGAEVRRFRVGDQVFCAGHLQEIATVLDTKCQHLPPGSSWQTAACLDPAEFALAAVRDSRVRLGDVAVVFGLGALGLCIIGFACRQGASKVYGVDPNAKKRDAALMVGASRAFAPGDTDLSLEVRRLTKSRGADVSFEASGSYAALHEAIRVVGVGATVVSASAYRDECQGGLMLGAEFHLNRPTLVSSRASTEPNRDCPLWDHARTRQVAWEMLLEGNIPCVEIVQPVIPFKAAGEAFAHLGLKGTGDSVKLGVMFT